MHGRHPVYAKGKKVALGTGKSAKAELVEIESQHATLKSVRTADSSGCSKQISGEYARRAH
jgi:hypothetical protein